MSVSKSKTANKNSLDACNDVNKGESQVQDLPQQTDSTKSLEEVVLDVSQEKTVFAIDHLREFIFHLLDKPTLLTSRLVCYRWKYFASKELQKTITFILRQVNPPGRAYSGVQNDPNYSFIGPVGNVKPDPSRSVSCLIALLENSTKSEFPCISVNYWVSYWINPESFFDTYGPYLKKLKLIGPYADHPIIFKDLKQMLSTQAASNIEQLIFDGKVVFQKSSCLLWNEDTEEYTEMHNYVNENEFKSTQYYDAFISEGFANLNLSHLKRLEIRAEIHETILWKILEASPNLSQVKMTCNEFLNCLVAKPRRPGAGGDLNNRRHLLKELKIVFTEKSLESLEIFANANDNPLAIRNLCLECAPELERKKHLIPRFSGALCKILEGCSASLEELTWGQMEFLAGLQFPPMPNVEKIILCYSHKDDEVTEDINGRHRRRYHPIPTKFFPKMEFDLGTTFPNLNYVEFCAPRPVYFEDDFGCMECEDDPDYDGIQIRMNELFQNMEPVEGVTRVALGDLKESESLRTLFPNAAFTGKFCQQGVQ